MIDMEIIPAKIAIIFGLITLRKIIISGVDIATIAIIKASEVPMGMPFSTRA